MKMVEGTNGIGRWTAPEGRSEEEKTMPKDIVVGILRIGVNFFEL
jgi:hypothetical protein